MSDAGRRRPRRQPNKPEFLPYADGLRVIAVLAVIALHTSAVRVVHLPPGSLGWWTAHVIDSCCRWAVPIFIMLSGALVLEPARAYRALSFYGKRLRRVGIPLLCWAGWHFFWSAAFHGERIIPAVIGSSIWDGLTQYHLYFLVIIINLYLLTPPLRALVANVPPPALWAMTAVALWGVSLGVVTRYVPMMVLTRGLPYVPYFVLGYLLRRGPSARLLNAASLCAFAAASVWIILGTAQRVQQFGTADGRAFALYDHFYPCVMVQAVCVFILC